MKRKFGIVLLSLCLVLLTGCRGSEIENSGNLPNSESNSEDNLSTESEESDEYTIEYKEVAFKNSYDPFYTTDGLGVNWIYSTYSDATDEKLYAFCVELVYNANDDERQVDETAEEYRLRLYQQSSKIVVEKALEMGLMVCPEYAYCAYNNERLEEIIELGGVANPILGDCVIIGRIDEIKTLFMKTSAIDGRYWELHAAPRPDWSNLMAEIGWNGTEEMHTQSIFYSKNIEKIENLIGDESQVTLTVPVIIPEEATESN